MRDLNPSVLLWPPPVKPADAIAVAAPASPVDCALYEPGMRILEERGFAGEIMAGNVLGQGYLAGIGMTIGTVFGRIAGEGAARTALQPALA